MSEHYIRQPRALEVEESMDPWSPKVEVDEQNTPTCPGIGKREIGDRRRLTFSLFGARDHDRPRFTIEIHELDVRAQQAEGLAARAVRVGQHHEPVLGTQSTRRLRKSREQREAESLAYLGGAPDPRVKCLGEEGEAEAEAQSESEAEDPVSHWPGPDLLLRRRRDGPAWRSRSGAPPSCAAADRSRRVGCKQLTPWRPVRAVRRCGA